MFTIMYTIYMCIYCSTTYINSYSHNFISIFFPPLHHLANISIVIPLTIYVYLDCSPICWHILFLFNFPLPYFPQYIYHTCPYVPVYYSSGILSLVYTSSMSPIYMITIVYTCHIGIGSQSTFRRTQTHTDKYNQCTCDY